MSRPHGGVDGGGGGRVLSREAVAHVDVVVAGAGPAGAVTARRLAQLGRSVVLVDGGRVQGYGETLASAARPILAELGLWFGGDGFVGQRHRRCPGSDSAWGSPMLASVDTIADPNGPSWHIDRTRFDDWLVASAAAAGATVVPGRVRAAAAGIGVELGDGRAVRARWVVDATGRSARIARSCGVERRVFDMAVALVGWTAGSPGDVDGRSLVEAAPDGWWYTAAVPGGTRVVVYVTDRDLVPAGARTDAGFADLLAASSRHVARRVGSVPVGPVRQVAAGGSRLAASAGEGWLAVGDAACAFDPLSSQGLVCGLYTGMAAGDALAAALEGDDGAVARYGLRVDRIVDNYLGNVREFYGVERRWADRPFWQRRHGVVAGGVAQARSLPG